MQRRRRPPRPGVLTDLPPLKIVTRIVVLQAAYYACATILILFTALVAGTAFSPDLILSWRSLSGDTTIGWTLGLVWLLNSAVGVIFLLLWVSRSKLIPDFALTIHFIHLLVTSFYTHSLPTNFLWWGLQVVSSALMTFLGMWACRWRELQPIVFGGSAANASSNDGGNNGTNQSGEDATGDEDGRGGGGGGIFEFSRGRGRGRNMEGYEMVAMKERADDPV
ncbi:integral membrane protein [Histoplasma capsulatum]|uniref:Integral membrane protein n=1 Tax=Ajellomyces capsulatus TaxID=5037 RepID=A0A8A1MC63_AJECA|nr:conserved hypothetical protein [Histoplasma mississippiense (nom. inval.)]EDN08949.1 conserved hypothetical protein [Histoplasma mississippiense (nom. inval.)]QSS63551.1 integral membrane protein [Histoplasma capsulatum]